MTHIVTDNTDTACRTGQMVGHIGRSNFDGVGRFWATIKGRKTIQFIKYENTMSALLDIYLKKEALEKLLQAVTVRQQKGIGVTVSVEDKTNDYGNNVTAWVSQSKEERALKKEKFYVGNGKVFYTKDNHIEAASRVEREPAQSNGKLSTEGYQNDLPF